MVSVIYKHDNRAPLVIQVIVSGICHCAIRIGTYGNLVDSTGNTFYEYGSEEDIVDAREALVQNDDKKNDSKNKRKALTGDIVFHDKSATCGYEVVSIVNKESIWMVLFPYIAGLFGTLAIFLLLVL